MLISPIPFLSLIPFLCSLACFAIVLVGSRPPPAPE
jgi:hypothetical protein